MPMSLSRFITEQMETILDEWESFARTLLPAAGNMDTNELRDHARGILRAVAADLTTSQTLQQQDQKAKGNAPEVDGVESAASTHGTLRQVSGFTLPQLTSEYRALRASVLRMWVRSVDAFDKQAFDEMVRFNEAVDQAIAESVVTFAAKSAITRHTFLGILGHDLRSPLHAIALAGESLARPVVDEERRLKLGYRVRRSVATMTTMVDDLLEYARTQLGGQIPIRRQEADMGEICQFAADDAAAAHPECPFEVTTSGDLADLFDVVRLQQVFANLLNNAAQYRGTEQPVTVAAIGEPKDIVVKVTNFGPAIPAAALEQIFDMLVQLPMAPGGTRPLSSVGLGLFIAREIVVAHSGTLTAESSAEKGTTFTVRLPRFMQTR